MRTLTRYFELIAITNALQIRCYVCIQWTHILYSSTYFTIQQSV